MKLIYKILDKIFSKYGYHAGITFKVNISNLTDEQKQSYFVARDLLSNIGISCDSGCGISGVSDLEFDWSLTGANCICKRCGYESQKHNDEFNKRNCKN